jgi:hypothetical protein
VEELASSSGLPLQASIAGCLSSRGQAEVWGASLARLGQERSRVETLPSHLPALLEGGLFTELASAVLENVWMGSAGPPGSCTEYVFLTSLHHSSGVAIPWGQVYLVQLTRTDPAGCEAGPTEDSASETWESVVPDTDYSCTAQQMARAWRAITRPLPEDDVPLSVDPDDYPLF